MALTNDFKVKNGLTVTDSISAGSCIEASCFIKNGGTSSQFLKADGSVDSNAYTTCCGNVTGSGVNNRLALWSGTSTVDSDSVTLPQQVVYALLSTLPSAFKN